MKVASANIGRLAVSLPENTVEMAKAAIEAGADSVKVHINLHHGGSGHTFGPLAQYRDVFREIIELGTPVGLVPGGTVSSVEEMVEAQNLGFSYFNADLHVYTADFLESTIELVPAPGDMFAQGTSEWLRYLREYPGTWIEGFPIDGERIGTPLSWQDLLGIRHIGQLSGRKVLVPSVNSLRPSDAKYLFETPEVGGLLLGVIAIGTTTDSVSRGVAAFRAAIDSLGLDPA